MTVHVIVPYRSSCPYRDRAWQWVRARWAERYPNWPIIECSDGLGGWRKGAAVREGLLASAADIVIVADADVWADGIGEAVDYVANGAPWAMGYTRLTRLTATATEKVLGGADLAYVGPRMASWLERPYRQSAAGGLVVLPRETAESIPMDPRFLGWGGEDGAWKDALNTLAGQMQRHPGMAYHLWHPPAIRLSRAVGSRDSEALRRRYTVARGQPATMRSLLDEIQR